MRVARVRLGWGRRVFSWWGDPLERSCARAAFAYRFTTEEDIDFTVNKVVTEVTKLREMSPLWEMHLEGIDISKIQWSQH